MKKNFFTSNYMLTRQKSSRTQELIRWITEHCDGIWDWMGRPSRFRDTIWYQHGKLLFAYGLFNFVGPFCWLTVLNIKIILGIRKSSKFRRETARSCRNSTLLQIPNMIVKLSIAHNSTLSTTVHFRIGSASIVFLLQVHDVSRPLDQILFAENN